MAKQSKNEKMCCPYLTTLVSGSPIIQNGKLVGAVTFAEQTCDEAKLNMVTHVLINDPTTGYGLFIENMLNAAQMPEARVS